MISKDATILLANVTYDLVCSQIGPYNRILLMGRMWQHTLPVVYKLFYCQSSLTSCGLPMVFSDILFSASYVCLDLSISLFWWRCSALFRWLHFYKYTVQFIKHKHDVGIYISLQKALHFQIKDCVMLTGLGIRHVVDIAFSFFFTLP